MLPLTTNEHILRQQFRWNLPQTFNIAASCCDIWAQRTPHNPALIIWDNKKTKTYSFLDLQRAANRLANALQAKGIKSGDRVAICLPQQWETLVTHIACYKLNAIALPLSILFGREALLYRLNDAGAKALITLSQIAETIGNREENCPSCTTLIVTDNASSAPNNFNKICESASDTFSTHQSSINDPALLIYTSGTTGTPKGALHAHRVLLGHIPGYQLLHSLFPDETDTPSKSIWTPADWAWLGGLMNALFPALYFGIANYALPPAKFDPEKTLDFLSKSNVTNTFFTPTALNLLQQADLPRPNHTLNAIGTAGEKLTAQSWHWVAEYFGIPPDEAYGQTECNFVIGSSKRLNIARAGYTGKPTPGQKIAVLKSDNTKCKAGEIGEIAIHRSSPSLFLGYWQHPEMTRAKFRGDYFCTGDLARQTEEDYIEFLGRTDDMITTSGYRVSPLDIEACLNAHPDVKASAVTGKKDEIRTEKIIAFIVTATPSEKLKTELKQWVKQHLSKFEVPKQIEFIEQLPLTTTGKIKRRALLAFLDDKGGNAGASAPPCV